MSTADLILNVLFLVAIALLGFFCGKRLAVAPRDISVLLIYVVAPAVIFLAVLEAPPDKGYLLFSIGAYCACALMATLALLVGSWLWRDNTKNLFAFSGGTGNTGYFGLPIAFALFGDLGAAIAAFIIMGASLYEFTYGYYLASRGSYTVKDSLIKISRLPIVYAFSLALIARHFQLAHNEVLLTGLHNFKGAYSVMGMMVIGLTLSQFQRFQIDWKYLATALSWKHIAWPLLAVALLGAFGDGLSLQQKGVIMLMASVPMAGNTVVIASQLNVQPQKAATAVMASTLLALVTVPLSLAIL